VAAEGEVGVYAQLHRLDPGLVEPLDRLNGEALVLDVRERATRRSSSTAASTRSCAGSWPRAA